MALARSTTDGPLPAEQLLSVPEAARILHVSPSTVRRWIRQGRLPAYRTGRTRLWLRRTDVEQLDVHEPVRHSPEWEEAARSLRASVSRKMTPDEQAQLKQVLEETRELHARQFEERGGVPFPDSVQLIHQMREERMRQMESW